MNTFKKTLAVALAVALCACAAGCGKKEEEVLPVLAGDEVVMNIGSYDITADEYNYYFLYQKHSLDNGDSSYWTSNDPTSEELTEYSNVIKEYVNNTILETYALSVMCDNAGIAMTDEIKAQVESDIAMISSYYGGVEAFEEMLATSYLTLDLYRNMSAENQRTSLLFEEVMADELRANAAENYLRAAHILVMPDETAVDQAAARKDALAKAEEILVLVNSGEDFFKLVDEYNEDPGMVNNRDGYYFTEGDMVTPFYEGAMALADNEVSGVVETDYGYHIIKRLPMEDEYINAHLSEFATNDHYTAFYEEVAKVQETLEYTTTETYDLITLENAIKLEAAATAESEAAAG